MTDRGSLAVAQVVVAIRKHALRARVISLYDSAQTMACGTERYRSLEPAEGTERAERMAHAVAIACVRAFLVEYGAIPEETTAQVVGLAYSEIT